MEMNNSSYWGVPNNTSLPSLDPESLLNNVKVRYHSSYKDSQNENGIYTWTGTVLVAVNPYFEFRNLYGDEQIRQHFCKTITTADPHPFGVASHAYSCLNKFDGLQNQSIVISGESGAGKTETAKYVMRYLTRVSELMTGDDETMKMSDSADVSDSSIESRVLKTSPILEAFGNAKTLRNENSSRFGKLVRLQFEKGRAKNHSILTGASIETYLLARSRVIHVPVGERSYHIFYLLCNGLNQVNPSLYNELQLQPSRKYAYLNGEEGREHVSSYKDDKSFFEEVQQALSSLQVFDTSQEQADFFKILAGILWLGNISLQADCENEAGKTCIGGKRKREDNDAADDAVLIAAKLLGVVETEETSPAQLLSKMLTSQKLQFGSKDVIWSDLSVHKAKMLRDGLARTLYVYLFEYLVNLLNKNLAGGLNDNQQGDFSTISILDIFGFENIFNDSPDACNGFEQLCINFANERIQDFFLKQVVLSEVEEYKREHVPYTAVTPVDNTALVEFIGGSSTGNNDNLFGQLRKITTDCIVRPSDNIDYDFRYMESISNMSNELSQEGEGMFCLGGIRSKSSALRTRHRMDGDKYQFTICHYAEPVVYSAKGFVDKNKDDSDGKIKTLIDSLLIGGGNCVIERAVAFAEEKRFCKASESIVTMSRRTTVFGTTGGGTSSKFVPSFSAIPEGGDGMLNQSFSSAVVPSSKNRRVSTVAGFKGTSSNVFAGLASIFASQLDDLMTELHSTRSHYIRCIKPNDKQCKNVFDDVKVYKQLQVNGMFEVLVLMAEAFPIRIPYLDLYSRYQPLLETTTLNLLNLASSRGASAKLFVSVTLETISNTVEGRRLLNDNEISDDNCHLKEGVDFYLGTSKVFFKLGKVEPLETLISLDTNSDAMKAFSTLISKQVVKRRINRQRAYIKMIGWFLVIARRRSNYWKWFRLYFLRLSFMISTIRRKFLPLVYVRRIHKKYCATKIQNAWRSLIVSRRMSRVVKLQACIRMMLAKRRFAKAKKSIVTLQSGFRLFNARREFCKLYNDKKCIEEREAKRVADELEAKRVADELEAKRVADELEAKRVADELEAKRVADELEAKRVADELEAKRVADELEAKRIADELDAKRIADELEAKRVADEPEAKRVADELEAKRIAAELEAKRVADELEEKRIANELEAKRIALEAEETRKIAEADAERKIAEAQAYLQKIDEEVQRKKDLAAEETRIQRQETDQYRKRVEDEVQLKKEQYEVEASAKLRAIELETKQKLAEVNAEKAQLRAQLKRIELNENNLGEEQLKLQREQIEESLKHEYEHKLQAEQEKHQAELEEHRRQAELVSSTGKKRRRCDNEDESQQNNKKIKGSLEAEDTFAIKDETERSRVIEKRKRDERDDQIIRSVKRQNVENDLRKSINKDKTLIRSIIKSPIRNPIDLNVSMLTSGTNGAYTDDRKAPIQVDDIFDDSEKHDNSLFNNNSLLSPIEPTISNINQISLSPLASSSIGTSNVKTPSGNRRMSAPGTPNLGADLCAVGVTSSEDQLNAARNNGRVIRQLSFNGDKQEPRDDENVNYNENYHTSGVLKRISLKLPEHPKPSKLPAPGEFARKILIQEKQKKQDEE